MINVYALFLIWLGCYIAYLGATDKLLFGFTIRKMIGWSLFSLLQIAAVVSLQSVSGWIAASLEVLVGIICAWLIMVISSSHLKQRIHLVFLAGTGLFGLLAIIGAIYVA